MVLIHSALSYNTKSIVDTLDEQSRVDRAAGLVGTSMSQIFLDVQSFIDTGGPVRLAIGAVLVLMWTLMIERFYYFSCVFPGIADKTQREWGARTEHSSSEAHQIRRLKIWETSPWSSRAVSPSSRSSWRFVRCSVCSGR